jgi:hypothetical protein
VPTGIITNYGVTTGQITNLPEAIQDTIAASLTTTSGLAVIYDDAAGSIVLSGQRATTVNPGLAIFSATNFSVNSGLALITGGLLTGFIVNLPQAITGTVGSAVGIDDLSGVYLGTMTSGQYLFFNGTGWTGNSILTEAISAMKLPNGHEDRAASTLSFDEGTRTFSITPVGSSFSFWTSGRKYTKTTAQTIAIPDTSGLYYFYFNRDGNLAYKNTYFDFESDVHTAYVYWNANTDKAYYFADERHGTTMDWQTHEYLHRTRGAAYANGFGITNYDISGDGSSDTHAKLDIANGIFFDEDIEVIITHSATPAANSWQQVLQGNAEIPIFYLSGDSWVKDTATEFPLKQGVNTAQYNLLSGAIWTGVDLSGLTYNQTGYGITWIVATNNLNSPVLGILGQSNYTGLGQAESVVWGDVSLPGFPVFEFRPLYKVIYEAYTGYTNTPGAKFKSIIDLRVTQSVAGGIPATPVYDHGSLVGLTDDDHLQYIRVDGGRGFTAPVGGQDPVDPNHLATRSYVDSLTNLATTNSPGIAEFDPEFFEVTLGVVTITGVQTGFVTDLTNSIEDTIGNSGFFSYRGGLTGYWDQGGRVLTLNWISGSTVAVTDLDGLTDVTLNSSTINQVLAYNGSTWVNSGLTTGNIANFSEEVQDIVGNSLATTSGLAVIYNDTSNQIIISGQRASTSSIGLASFDSNNFTVASGFVSISSIQTGQITNYGVTTGQITNLAEAVQDIAAAALTTTSGLAFIYDDNNGNIILSGQRASTSTLGLSYFDSNNFTVVSGLVSISAVPTGAITNYGVTTGQISNLAEAIQDIAAASLSTTTGLAVIYDDANGNIILSGQRTSLTPTFTGIGLAGFSLTNFSVASGVVSITGGIQTGQIAGYGVTTGQVSNLSEAIQDTVAASLATTSGLAVIYDDTAGIITISGQRATTQNPGLALFDSSNFTVVSGLVSISAVPTGIITNYGVTTGQITNLPEAVQDIVAASLSAYTGITVIYNDTNGSILLSGQRATTSTLGIAAFDSNNFTVASGLVSISAVATGTITNLVDAIQDSIGSSGFFIYRGGLTGLWNHATQQLTINWISGKPTYSLDELSDVNASGPNLGDILYHDGIEWTSLASSTLTITTGQISSLPEAIVDQVAGALVTTSGLAVIYNDVGNLITISGQRATTTDPGLAIFSSANFTVASGLASISAVPTGVITNLPLAIDDTIGNSGFFVYRGGLTGLWDQPSRTLTLNWISGSTAGATTLNDLTDVDTQSQISGHYLHYNGSQWISQFVRTGDITNLPDAIKDTIGNSGFFDFRGGITGVWNQGSRRLTFNWISGKPSYFLDDLNDVVIAGTNPGDILYFDGAEWVNQASTSLGFVTGQISNLQEAIVDNTAAALATTSGLAVLYNDTNGIITISGQRATTQNPGLAIFDSANFTVVSGLASISAVATGTITNLPLAIKDTIGNSGFFAYRGGLTGLWDQPSRTLTLNWISGAGVGASALDDLTDVTITSLSAGQFLGYNGTTWVNSGIQSGNARWNASGLQGNALRIGQGDAASQIFGIGNAIATRDLFIYFSAAELAGLGSSAAAGIYNSTISTFDLIAEQAGVRFGADNLQGTGISTAPLVSGQVLYYNGTQWLGSGLIGRGTGAPSGTTTGDFYFQYFASGTIPVDIGVACSDETTALTVGTAKTTFRMPHAMYLTGVRANVNVGPTGSVLTVDINENGTTILSTKLTIDATEKTSTTAATPYVFSDTQLADDSEITIDIDGVGSTYAGRGLKVWLMGYRL